MNRIQKNLVVVPDVSSPIIALMDALHQANAELEELLIIQNSKAIDARLTALDEIEINMNSGDHIGSSFFGLLAINLVIQVAIQTVTPIPR